MSEETTAEESKDSNYEFENYIRIRNKKLHYHKAVLARIERENRRRRLVFSVLFLPLISVMSALSFLLIDDKKYIEKQALQDDLKSIISNGGDLDAIKQAFATQPSVSQVKLIFASKSSYYETGTPLSTALNDLRVNAFRGNDKDILPMLNPIISEYEEINPFDKLQAAQKDYFENVRIKTEDEYIKISNDINNIADELHQKNILVEEYLGDSKTSFWISIIAVILSLLIGGYQIFSARPEAMKKLFLDALNGFDRAEDKDLRNKKNSNKNIGA